MALSDLVTLVAEPWADWGLIDCGHGQKFERYGPVTVVRAADDLSEAELARARAQVEAGLLMALETPQGRADSIARSIELFDRIMPLDEMLAEIRCVDVAAARAAGQALLDGPRAAASIGGKLALAA